MLKLIVTHPPSSLCPLRGYLHCCTCCVSILIVGPSRSSSLLRPSRVHLICRAIGLTFWHSHALSFIAPSCTQLHLFIVPLCAHLSTNLYKFQCITNQLAHIFLTHNLVATMFLASFPTSEPYFECATLHSITGPSTYHPIRDISQVSCSFAAALCTQVFHLFYGLR